MPDAERKLHIISEAIAVFIITPIIIYIAFQQKNKWYKYFLLLLSIGTIIVDGYLLIKWYN